MNAGKQFSPKEIALGVKMTKLTKRLLKQKRPPTREEILKLGQVCEPGVTDEKQASTVLMTQGVNTLMNSGVIPENDVSKIVSTITERAGEFENIGDFAETLLTELPIPDEAKILAAAFISED
jgi:hypothetical protein